MSQVLARVCSTCSCESSQFRFRHCTEQFPKQCSFGLRAGIKKESRNEEVSNRFSSAGGGSRCCCAVRKSADFAGHVRCTCYRTYVSSVTRRIWPERLCRNRQNPSLLRITTQHVATDTGATALHWQPETCLSSGGRNSTNIGPAALLLPLR